MCPPAEQLNQLVRRLAHVGLIRFRGHLSERRTRWPRWHAMAAGDPGDSSTPPARCSSTPCARAIRRPDGGGSGGRDSPESGRHSRLTERYTPARFPSGDLMAIAPSKLGRFVRRQFAGRRGRRPCSEPPAAGLVEPRCFRRRVACRLCASEGGGCGLEGAGGSSTRRTGGCGCSSSHPDRKGKKWAAPLQSLDPRTRTILPRAWRFGVEPDPTRDHPDLAPKN